MKIFFVITTLLLSSVLISAQESSSNCVRNNNAPPANSYYWPPDTDVRVFLVRGMFTPEQTETLLSAMSGWSNASAQADAGINFTYAGEVSSLMDCVACLTVTRRDVHKSDRKHYAFFNPLKQRSDGLLISAWIDFDFATTRPAALRGYMAHELGHGMGLWDCTTCEKRKTIMNGFPGVNSHNGLIEPSVCDLEVVRQVYQLQRRVAKNMVASRDQQ
jgi:hypothetical protein